MSGLVIWITGLPGSGKSTISEDLCKRRTDFVILKMDDLRKVITPQPTYSESERDLVYRSIVYAAKIISDLGHNVIIDATGNLRVWRDLARKIISNYAEVYLKCSLEICRVREESRTQTHGAPRNIYSKGKKGWPVPGISAPYEEPLNPEISIDTDEIRTDEAVEIILRFIDNRKAAI